MKVVADAEPVVEEPEDAVESHPLVEKNEEPIVANAVETVTHCQNWSVARNEKHPAERVLEEPEDTIKEKNKKSPFTLHERNRNAS